jgi:hypothetical protein
MALVYLSVPKFSILIVRSRSHSHDDSLTIFYYQGEKPRFQHVINNNDYSIYNLRNKIREIIKLDLEKPILQLAEC